MNIDESDNEVLRINSRGRTADIVSTVVGGFAWVVVAAVVLLKPKAAERLDASVTVAYGICAIGLAVNVVMFVRQIYGKRVTFDRRKRVVEIARLFSKTVVMSFESIGRLAPLTYKTMFTTREAYCLVPAIAPIFGTKIISPICKPRGREIEDFRLRIAPKVEHILGLEHTSFKKLDAAATSPSHYKREGTRYVKTLARWHVPMSVFLIAVAVMLASAVPFALKSDEKIILLAALAAIAAPVAPFLLALLFVPAKSISYDPQRKNIELKRGAFGWGGVKSYGFSSIKSFEVRGFGNGSDVGSGKRIYLKLDETKKMIPAIPAMTKGKMAADELKFIAGLLDLDPVRDITYTVYQITSNTLEVP